MISSLIVAAVIGLGAASQEQPKTPAPQQPTTDVQVAPPSEPPKTFGRKPFTDVFSRPDKPPPVTGWAQTRGRSPQTARVECGLVVWQVDASTDPWMVIRAPDTKVDPKIVADWSGPCTGSKR